ncbi:MAG TPA: ATP-binding protein [Verrucomicrobiae bacterium]|jgi:signal transduction histidine kinase|nr:ATP-binding protein [Verrucomicrobiae bacterium]
MMEPGASNGALVKALERERRSIGEELHDHLCQTLVGSTLLLQTIERAATAGEPVSTESVAGLKQVIETAIDQTRALSRRFSPAKLQGAGLIGALHDLAQERPPCQFVCEKRVFVMDAEKAQALHQIAQEAVENALEYAGAQRIEIRLEEAPGMVLLEVKDDGRGFVPGESPSFGGLDTSRLLAESLAGTLELTSKPGEGTTVTCQIPLN